MRDSKKTKQPRLEIEIKISRKDAVEFILSVFQSQKESDSGLDSPEELVPDSGVEKKIPA